jgi:hypothetical protein
MRWRVLGDGAVFLFWSDSDPWFGGARLTDLAPDLVGAVSSTTRKRRTVASTLMNQAWIQDITGALIAVIIQYIDIRHRLQEVQLIPGIADRLLCRWEGFRQLLMLFSIQRSVQWPGCYTRCISALEKLGLQVAVAFSCG